MSEQEKIIALLHRRSEQAIQELERCYGGLCSAIAGKILSSREDVQEIVNDTLLAAWNNIPPECPRSLSAYLSRITRNLSLARLRNNRAARRNEQLTVCLEELEFCLGDSATPEQVLNQKLLTQAINAFLTTLTSTNRYLFVRRYYYLDGYDELASNAGLTQQAVRTRLMRLRQQLRQYLEKEEIIE